MEDTPGPQNRLERRVIRIAKRAIRRERYGHLYWAVGMIAGCVAWLAFFLWAVG